MNLSQHWITKISAHRNAYENAPLKIELRTHYSEMPTDITLYLDNDALTAALVKAINETVAAHRPQAIAQAAE